MTRSASAPHPAAHAIVRDLCEAMGADASAVVRRAGFSMSWWYKIKVGRHSPSLDNLEALANAAGKRITLI